MSARSMFPAHTSYLNNNVLFFDEKKCIWDHKISTKHATKAAQERRQFCKLDEPVC